MAKWIDQAALWALAATAAFVLWMVLGGGHIPLAMAAAFATVWGMRYLLHRLPERRWVFRGERVRRAQALVGQWACARQPEEALSELDRLLPALSPEDTGKRLLIQRLSGSFDEDALLALWRQHEGVECLTLIVTVRATAQAQVLARRLTHPVLRLIDGTELIRLLTRISLPATPKTKTGRRQSLGMFAARLAENVRPLRAALYGALFALLYGLTHSWLYLFAAVVQALLAGSGLFLRRLRRQVR